MSYLAFVALQISGWGCIFLRKEGRVVDIAYPLLPFCPHLYLHHRRTWWSPRNQNARTESHHYPSTFVLFLFPRQPTELDGAGCEQPRTPFKRKRKSALGPAQVHAPRKQKERNWCRRQRSITFLAALFFLIVSLALSFAGLKNYFITRSKAICCSPHP